MVETLIYHKKKMYYLLSHIPEKDIMESEKDLLNLLSHDIELLVELDYTKYMKGEQ